MGWGWLPGATKVLSGTLMSIRILKSKLAFQVVTKEYSSRGEV